MKKQLFLALMISILIIVPVNGQNVEKCTTKILEKFPKMNKVKAINNCKIAISKINSSLKSKYVSRYEYKIKGLNIKPEHSSIIPKFTRSEIKDLIKKEYNNSKKIKEKEYFNENALIKRKINSSKITKSRKTVFQAVIYAKKYNQNHRELINVFSNNKKNLIYCTDCRDTRLKIKNNFKDMLLNFADKIEILIIKIKAKATANPNIKDIEENNIVNNLNLILENLNITRNKVENAESKYELNTSKHELILLWKETKIQVMTYTNLAKKAKLSEVVVRAQRLEEKLYLILSNIQNNNIDIDKKLNTFSDNINGAKKEILKINITQNSQQNIAIANNLISQAHMDLTKILKIIKANKEASKELDKSDEELAITEAAYIAISKQ